MIDINELRRLAQAAMTGPDGVSLNWVKLLQDFQKEANPAAVSELLDRLEAAESDALEQARMNGMGASREAALLAKLEAAEKERDALRVDKATLQQMLYSIKNRLEAAEKSDVESITMYWRARDERDALRAKIEAMEQQEPYAFAVAFPESSRVELVHDLDEAHEDMIYEAYEVRKLYLAPGAKGE